MYAMHGKIVISYMTWVFYDFNKFSCEHFNVDNKIRYKNVNLMDIYVTSYVTIKELQTYCTRISFNSLRMLSFNYIPINNIPKNSIRLQNISQSFDCCFIMLGNWSSIA